MLLWHIMREIKLLMIVLCHGLDTRMVTRRNTENSKIQTQTATILHWTLIFCIASCSQELLHSLDRCFVLESDDGAACRKSHRVTVHRYNHAPCNGRRCEDLICLTVVKSDCNTKTWIHPYGDQNCIHSFDGYNLSVS